MATLGALGWSVTEDSTAQGADFSAGCVSIVRRNRALPTQRHAQHCLATWDKSNTLCMFCMLVKIHPKASFFRNSFQIRHFHVGILYLSVILKFDVNMHSDTIFPWSDCNQTRHLISSQDVTSNWNSRACDSNVSLLTGYVQNNPVPEALASP